MTLGTSASTQRPAVFAATEFWTELHSRMQAFIGSRIEDHHTAEDLVQEVLLRLHRHLPKLRDEERVDAMAYTIARNAVTDHYRSGGRRRETPIEDPDLFLAEQTEESDEATDSVVELARCLTPLVDRLEDSYRDAIRLTDLGPLTQAEAADRLGLSVPGMKSRVQRARAQLRDRLRACCEVRLDPAGMSGDVQRVGPCACRDQVA